MRAMVRMKDGGRREKRRGKDEDHGTKVGRKEGRNAKTVSSAVVCAAV